jgi:PASTA domain-containing protein/glycosyl hydrolase family 26
VRGNVTRRETYDSSVGRRKLVIAVGVMLACMASLGTAADGRTGAAAGVFTRLLPPPDGKTYFGFTFRLWDSTDPAVGDSRPFDQRIHDSIQNELAGKTPTFLNVWAGWQDPANHGNQLLPFSNWSSWVSEVRGITGAHSLLYLDWNLASTTAQNGGVTTKDIASGALDAYIRQYARDLKAFADPVLIRLFGGEFNGSWWYGQSPLANPNLTPADFVAAWRRVVDIFRQVGAANVSFAWIPVVYPPYPAGWVDPNIAAYYPGDSYVDWAGADTGDFAPPDWLDSTYAFASSHAKPFFLAEFGVRHPSSTLTPAQGQAWLGSMFDYIESHPGIKAINYFNYNARTIPWDPSHAVYLYGGQVNYLPNVDDGDQRLLAESGANFRGTYSSRIANPRYTSTILTQQITPRIQCLVPNVKNRPLATARRMILAHHCSIGGIRRAYSKHVRKGRVISQKPRPSTLLPNHGKVTLVASRGRKP